MYKWNIDDLKNLMRIYEEKARTATDEDLKSEYESTINNILEVMESYEDIIYPSIVRPKIFSIVPNTHIDVVKDDISKHQLYSAYFPLIESFRDSMDGTVVELQDNLPRIKSSQNSIVTVTTQFYHHFRGIFAETYDELSSKFRDRLCFRKPNRNEKYGGNTYSIYGTKEAFIECIKDNTIQDYISLIHESSHGITCKLNQGIMWDWNKYCLIEVDSLFFEMIGTGYVADLMNCKDDGLRVKIATFKDHLYSADIICSKVEMYGELSEKELRSKRLVSNFYRNEIGYNKTATNDAMYSRIQDYMHYIISYLIAIELYMIFINDKDLALNLLYKIIMLKNLNNREYLDSVRKLGIEPGRNAKEYYNLLHIVKGDASYGKKLQRR